MKRTLVWIALTLASSPLARPQGADPVAAFIESARAATAKFQDRSVAIAEGYRQIGKDFPAMGEHWIRIGLLFDGKFDAAHPEILNYAVVSGKPVLLGVAYVLPLLPGESAPDGPVGREKWHDHFRTIEDETTLSGHHAGHSEASPRMTMLHAWIWLVNPAGMFAADNWAIPYARLGVKPPEDAPDTAAKSLALVTGGAAHFSASIQAAAPLTPHQLKKVDAAFERARNAVQTLLRGAAIATHTQPELAKPELAKLSAVWRGLWNEIDLSVDAKTRPLIQNMPIR